MTVRSIACSSPRASCTLYCFITRSRLGCLPKDFSRSLSRARSHLTTGRRVSLYTPIIVPRNRLFAKLLYIPAFSFLWWLGLGQGNRVCIPKIAPPPLFGSYAMSSVMLFPSALGLEKPPKNANVLCICMMQPRTPSHAAWRAHAADTFRTTENREMNSPDLARGNGRRGNVRAERAYLRKERAPSSSCSSLSGYSSLSRLYTSPLKRPKVASSHHINFQ